MRLLPVIAVLASFAAPATAATVNTAFARNSGATCGPGYVESQTSPGGTAIAGGSTSITVPPGCGLSSQGIAGAGFASTVASAATNRLGTYSSEASASVRTDLMIISPNGVDPNIPIPVQVAFAVDVILFADAPDGDRQGTAVATYDFFYSISGSQGPSNTATAERRLEWNIADSPAPGNSGGLNPVSSGVFSSVINIIPAAGINIFFRAESTAFAAGCNFCPPGIRASSDARNTASFATDGPAFILPEGYFVNAPDLGIVNNFWIDPRIVDPPAPVPLPASLPLLLLGASALAFAGRRRARKKR